MSKWGKRNRSPPGYEYIQPVMDALENEMREQINSPHESLRKCEALWPIHQITWQRSRYVYDMYYKYHKISKEVYDYCIRMKLVDANLISKWKKPGYEKLCSTYAINSKNYNYGTVSICRVPRHSLSEDQVVQERHSGCRGCASGPGGRRNIFGNKYGQYLAGIQIAREKKAGEKAALTQSQVWAEKDEDYSDSADGDNEDDDEGDEKTKNHANQTNPSDESDESNSDKDNTVDSRSSKKMKTTE